MSTPISPKVTAGAATGAVATLVIWGLQHAGWDVPVVAAGLIPTGLGAVAAWVKKDPLRKLRHGDGEHVASSGNVGAGS